MIRKHSQKLTAAALPEGRSLAWFIVIALAIFHGWSLVDRPFAGHSPDVIHTYVPASKQVLKDGVLAYFSSAESMRIPPVPALWGALWGADPDLMRTVHCILGGVSVGLIAYTALLLSGTMAMLFAAILWAAIPTTRHFLASALTEPLYVVLVLSWFVALLRYLRAPHVGLLALIAVFGGLSILQRPLLFYPAIALSLICAPFAWRGDMESRRHARHLCIACVATIMLPISWMIFNRIQHGVFSIAAGAGATLYLGLNPFSGGLEPPHLLLNFDVNSVVNGDHLTMQADRILRKVSREFLREMTSAEFLQWGVNKLKWTLFFSQFEFPVHRAWRAALLVLGAFGLWQMRGRRIAWFIAALMLLLTLQQIPALFTQRYSVASLEPWIVLTAALGLTAIFGGVDYAVRAQRDLFKLEIQSTDRTGAPMLTRLLTLFFAIAGAQWVSAVSTSPNLGYAAQIAPRNSAATTLLARVDKPKIVLSNDAQVLSDGSFRGEARTFAAEMAIELPPDVAGHVGDVNAYWVIEGEHWAGKRDGCTLIDITYMPHTTIPTKVQFLRTEAPQRVGTFHVILSATRMLSPISPKGSGTMRFAAQCRGENARFRVDRVSLVHIDHDAYAVRAGVRKQ